MNSFYVITSPPNQMIRTFRPQPIGPDFFYLHHTISADSKYHSEIQCIYARNITLEISMFYARNITLIFYSQLSWSVLSFSSSALSCIDRKIPVNIKKYIPCINRFTIRLRYPFKNKHAFSIFHSRNNIYPKQKPPQHIAAEAIGRRPVYHDLTGIQGTNIFLPTRKIPLSESPLFPRQFSRDIHLPDMSFNPLFCYIVR